MAQERGQLPYWQIGPEPSAVIGAEGRPETEFSRIVGVTRMPSGNIVVANAGSLELRFFSPSGEYLRSLGGRGAGPGELRTMTRIFRGGDSLLVFDGPFGGSWLHAFSESAGFLTRTTLRTATERLAPLRRFASGRFLSARSGARPVDARPGVLIRDSIQLGVYTPGDPGTVVWVGTFPGITLLAFAPYTPPPTPRLARYPYGSQTVYEVSGDRLWLGDSHRLELTVFDATGRVVVRPRLPLTQRPIDQARLNRVTRREVAAAADEDEKARLNALRDAASRESSAPLFSRLVAGPDGEMWVELFREDLAAPGVFLVLSPSGAPVARARAPARVQFFEIGQDYALGVRTEDDGVERVIMYGVRR
jgi:hypothetical protein